MVDLYKKLKIYGIKKFASYLVSELRNKYYELVVKSFSQRQEDLKIDELLGHERRGFYVDVGAHDPTRFSNTKRFYLKGWCGINIEPDANRFQMFVKERTRDINLNLGVTSGEEGMMTFYKIFPPTLSTFSAEEAKSYVQQGYQLLEEVKVKTKSLAYILDTYAQDKKIDFISIDTEGFDMIVLKSNNWEKYRPMLICIESVNHTQDGSGQEHLDQEKFLLNLGYTKVYDNNINAIFKDSAQLLTNVEQ